MAGAQVLPPFPVFTDVDGNPVDDGYIYVGQEGLDPIASPVSVFWDRALTVPATQPIRTIGGYPSNAGVRSVFYSSEPVYSILVRNKNGTEIYSDSSSLSSTDLESRLADSTDPTKGAAQVGRATVSLNGVISLLTAKQDASLSYITKGYNVGSNLGSRTFYWSPSTLKSLHNGGSVISPTVPWNGSAGTLAAFLAGTGETAPGGSGCFIVSQESAFTTPEMFGAIPSFSTDVTVPFQAAVYAAVNGQCTLSAANYRVGPIKIKGFTTLKGSGKGTAVILANNALGHLFTENDPTVDTDIQITDLRINGNRTNQTLANDAIHFTSTIPGIGLTKHIVKDFLITNVKGTGIYMDTLCRESQVLNGNINDCDGNGLYVGWSDGQVANVIVGRSGLTGVVVRQGLQLSNVKSWYSGRVDLVGSGFEIRDADNAKLTNCWTQENQGHGYDIFASSGTIKSLVLSACTADSDNVSNTSKNAFNIVNAANSTFDVVVRTFVGSAGAPQIGIQIGNATTDCEIKGTVTGMLGRAVEANLSAGNTVTVNGRNGRVRQITYAATVSNDPWTQETIRIPLTGNILIDNPQRNPHGLILRYILNQDPTGGRVTTFGTLFKFKWTPDTAANKTNTITFLCDGTNWIQVDASTGL